MNVKNHHLYNDKLRLGVVDLTHIELATDEDAEILKMKAEMEKLNELLNNINENSCYNR